MKEGHVADGTASWGAADSPLDWMERASCKGRTNLFFGIPGERPERRARREASASKICDACPVLAPCRRMARDNHENGYWGGESEEDRAAAGFPPRSISRRAVQQAAAS
jgi:WhiB family redox-sensing transcriptional regulator